LKDEAMLLDFGIQNGSIIYMAVLISQSPLRGKENEDSELRMPGFSGREAAKMESRHANPREPQDLTPKYSRAKHNVVGSGLNLQGKCLNQRCEFFNKHVWI
jgi:hypothetical protein